MIPAARAVSAVITVLLIFFEKNTLAAPSVVIKYIMSAAISACTQASNEVNHCIRKNPRKLPEQGG